MLSLPLAKENSSISLAFVASRAAGALLDLASVVVRRVAKWATVRSNATTG
jgi:hypothetical protein